MKPELNESLSQFHLPVAGGTKREEATRAIPPLSGTIKSNGDPWRGAEAQQSTAGRASEAGEVSGYSILGQDGDRVLRREWRLASDGTRGVVLVAAFAAEHPTKGSVERLAHEWELRKDLDGDWAARPLALERERDGMALVLEDTGSEPLEQLMDRPMETGAFLRLAAGIARALGKLHQRSLVHKDVKPANILVNHETGEIRLTGFGLASRLPRERQAPESPEFIAGTLAYIAPEQTGRMNRSIDSRSDLYALGVTLYQMVTGSLPFTATDPMEWVHCHIARKPVPPSERLENVPATASAIIMRLIAKTAEDRYQTAGGVEHDLRRCLAAWEAHGRIDDFPLGEHDTRDRLLIPEKLYGREREIATLLASFDRVVSGGRPELVLVSGYSGIGKSSVVHELNRVLVPTRGLFGSGKFDQYKRDIPYSTLAQAFQGLIRSLLSKNEGELNKWRNALDDALGPNAKLIVNLVPELQLIIGEPPPVTDLPLQDAQRRFQLVFRRFIGVFARPEHPLALFLDDLQWLDSATLDLVEDLLTQSDVRYLMLIGAYRDNEVDSLHPLMRKLDTFRTAGAPVQEVVLAPLTREALTALISDSLHCDPEPVTALVELLHEKTAGNPFFTIQFISALVEEGLVTFDYGEGRWSWDLNRIGAKGYTDNVVDLMVGKLNRLPIDTQEVLQQLACLGHSAAITMLALVHGTSEEEVHARLWEASRNEMIERLEDAYRFVHDRVQEAAYSLIPEEGRAAAHLRIGQLLSAHTPPEKREEAIFEIVNQLNRGTELITSVDERDHLAELNLIAARRAKASTAYASALQFSIAGAALLTQDCWERCHDLIFQLELHRAECEFLTGALEAAEQRLNVLASRAETTIERASVTGLRVDLYVMLDQYTRAIAVGLDYLRVLGVEWSPHPTNQDVHCEYERIWSQLGSRAIEDLLELPLMTDAASLATMDVITLIAPAAFFTEPNLHDIAVCWAVNLSLERGNSDASCDAYVRLGLIASQRFRDHQAAYRLGQLAYELIEQRGFKRFQARTYHHIGTHLIPCAKHVRAARELLRRSFQMANESGDLLYASCVCNALNQNLLSAGDALGDVQVDFEHALEFVRTVAHRFSVDIVSSQLAYVRNLRGLTRQFGSFDDGQYDEHGMEGHFSENPNVPFPEWWYWILKLQAHFHAGDYTSALRAARRVERLPSLSRLLSMAADYHLFSALSHAASCDSGVPEQQTEHMTALAAHHSEFIAWAESGPVNFENVAALVGAEIARLEGRELDAMRLYERAIQSARANGFVHHEALAHELAGRFCLRRGFETAGSAHLRHARASYALWGADGKVRQLDELYPHLRKEEFSPDARGTIGAPVEHLELKTVIRVSQTIAGEIVLEKLLDTLMRIALEEAGAERGLLIIPRGTEIHVQAEATTNGEAVIVRLEEVIAGQAEAPESVLSYVMRTGETVVLDDASTDPLFSADAYIRDRHARSLLCLPLLRSGKPTGVLYLENNLVPRVFTPARIAVLRMLASQAAMSLENSRLYRDLAEREAKIRRLVDADIVGVMIWELEGRILEANDVFLRMVGYERADLISGRLRWTALTPVEWRERDGQAIAELKSAGTFHPFEKEYFRKDGSRVPVLIGGAAFDEEIKHGVAFVVDITARKRAEEELRRSQHYLAEAQKVSHTGSWAWSPVSNAILYWSEECFRILGYDPAQGLPSFESSFERIHPEDRPAVVETIERAVREKVEFQIDYRLVLPDGTPRNVHIQSHPVLDASGELVEFVGTVMDVTEQKRASQERRAHLWFLESMDRINRAMQRSNDIELMTSGVIQEALEIFACDRASLTYPCDPDMPTYRTVMEHTSPEYGGELTLGQDRPMTPEWAEVTRRALHHPEPVVDPSLPPGRERFRIASLLAIAVRPKGDRPYLFVVHCERSRPWTATELRLLEETALRLGDALTSVLAHRNLLAREEDLRQSEAYLVEAQKLSHTGSWAWSPVEDVSYWSEECYRILGFDPRDGLPRLEELIQRIHPDDQPTFRESAEKATHGQSDEEVDYRVVHPDGAVRDIHSIGHPVFTPSGDLIEFTGTVIDITERKRAEEELRTSELERVRAEHALRDAREKLAQASRVATVAELSASIAHEINQPLQAIVANGHASLRWLDAAPPNIEKAISTAKRVVRDGNAAADVVSRIRALFKHAAPEKVDLDINKLILQVCSLMADEIQGNGVSLETELGEEVPRIRADAVQIQQVIVNLVRNAIEAMAATMERPKPLSIRSRREGDNVVVDVQDQGVGLADSEKIFEPFITTKGTGLGMGLAICRSIVEAHAGRIGAARNPERGVTFSFSLPFENSVTG